MRYFKEKSIRKKGAGEIFQRKVYQGERGGVRYFGEKSIRKKEECRFQYSVVLGDDASASC